MLGDPLADRILEALREQAEGLTRSQISDLLGRHYSTGQISTALTLLGEKNLARSENEPTAGRPVERWIYIPQCEKSELSEITTTGDWNECLARNAHVNPATRGVYEYRLTDSPSWLVFLAPSGVDLNNARRTLEAQFGEDRLVEVRPKRGTCGEEH